MLFFYGLKAVSGPVMFGFGAGYEYLHGLTSDQSNNVLVRISLSREMSMLHILKSDKIYTGFEIAARNGFSGALDIPDRIQDDIGGPTPIALSSPEIELLTTMRANLGETKGYLITKIGFDFSVLKFDRADLISSTVSNVLGFVGLGVRLSEKSKIHLLASGSQPLSKLHFNDMYSIRNPYAQKAVLIEYVMVS